MATFSFALTDENTCYYNRQNVSGGTGCYVGNMRKVSLKISPVNSNGEAWYGKELQIKEAYIKMTISGYYASDCYNVFYGSTSNAVNTVFPNLSNSEAQYSISSIEQKNQYYPSGRTFYFDITPIIKYAQLNWAETTWYLWHYTRNTSSEGVKYSAPTIYVETEECAIQYYTGESFIAAKPKIYIDSQWISPTFKYYNGSGWDNIGADMGILTDYTYPTQSMGGYNSNYACESSIYSDTNNYYRAVHTLGYNTGYGWVSSGSATKPWMQIHLPYPTYNILLTIKNATRSDVLNGPTSGEILYTNTKGMVYYRKDMLSTGIMFSDRDGATAGAVSTINVGNNYPIQNIIIECHTWEKIGEKTNACAIGAVSIQGQYYAK